MAKIRVINLAKELKLEVRELTQRLKEDLGLQVDNYLSSLDEATVERVRQTISQMAPKVEELRIGQNVKRRRRVAPAVAAPGEAEPGAGGSGAGCRAPPGQSTGGSPS